MPVNDKIRAPDYNDIRNKINSTYGPGSGTSGYGQTLRSTPVNESNRVTVNEWGNLRFDIINAWRHIFGVTPTIVLPTISDTIRYSETFVPDSGASDEPVTQFDTYCNLISANRFTVHPSQSATSAAASGSTVWPGPYGAFWTSRLQCTVTASWLSADRARYFFNSGGQLRIASSRSGGSTTQQSNSWTSILSAAGTIAFGAVVPEPNTSPADGRNFYRCTSNYQPIFSGAGSTPYGSNSYTVYVRTPGIADNSTGTAATVEFLLDFIDNYVDPGNSLYDTPDTIDAIDGTFAVNVSTLFATGVLEPPGTGSFTVEQPSITVGAIAPV